jgi:hypothetical protein
LINLYNRKTHLTVVGRRMNLLIDVRNNSICNEGTIINKNHLILLLILIELKTHSDNSSLLQGFQETNVKEVILNSLVGKHYNLNRSSRI